MKMRIMAALVAIVLLVSACSPKAKEQENTQPPEMITLRLAADERAVWDYLIYSFQQQHPHIRVEKVISDGRDWTAIQRFIQQKVAAGEIDLVPLTAINYDHQQLVPLDPWIQKSSLALDRFNPPLSELRQLSTDGQLYSLPLNIAPTVLLYRPAMFREAGVELPAQGWTWDQFREAVGRLAAGSFDERRWGFDVMGSPEVVRAMFRSMVEQASGGSWTDADERTLRESLQFFTTMVFTDQAMAPLPQVDWSQHVNLSSGPTWREQRAAITMATGTMEIQLLRLPHKTTPEVQFDLALLPAAPGHTPWGTVVPDSRLGIPTTSPHPEAAWLFLSHMVGPEGASTIARQGMLPLYQSDEVREAWFSTHPAPPPGTAVLFQTPWRIAMGSGEFDEIAMKLDILLRNNGYYALSGQMSAEEAIDQFLQERQGAGR